MWTRRVLRSAGCAVAMSILLAPLVAGTADQPGEPATEHARGGDSAARGRSPLLPGQSGASKIANQVIDLVDGAVSLDTEASRARWESEPFRTGQANRIGLRVEVEMESGFVQCSTGWQFTADDPYHMGPPTSGLPYIGDDIGTIGDDPRIAGERPDRPVLVYGFPSHFSAVYGLRAKIVCQAYPGPDFGGGAAPGRGMITDVKVLLRRE